MFPTKSLLYSYQNGLYWAIPLWSLVCFIFVCILIFVGHLDDWSLDFIMHLGKILRGFAWWEGGGLFKFFPWWLPLVPAWILRDFTSRLHLLSTFYKDRYSSNSATFRVPGFSAPLFPFINFSHFYFHALMDLSASPFLFVSTFFLFTLPCPHGFSRISACLRPRYVSSRLHISSPPPLRLL